MNVEYEIQKLRADLNNLQTAFLQSQRNASNTVGRVDDTSNKVVQITPYTDTKTAYYGDTSVTFYDAPGGRVSVFINDLPIDYSVSRIEDRLVVSFDQLEVASVQITISIQ